ncbi:HAMP domain-containing sensor histidine kinase [Micromonospora sp. NPDC051296]|uniref:sensor histidine kinase n=1 Tax=Micromonospora sp. NPDC051296 TaxID=3155046 RepID=UPI003449B05D
MRPRRTRLALPRRVTLRARLTLVYSALFLVAGVVLLGATYVLFNQQINRSTVKVVAQRPSPDTGSDATARQNDVVFRDGQPVAIDDVEKWMREQQQQLHDAATTSMLTQGGTALGVVGLAAAGFGWLIAGRVLSPLHRVTETARRIAQAPAADRVLHERIALRGRHDEVKDLADTFDAMIGRLDRSFEGQRRFIANASHELRTPLTLSRALVEIAMNRKAASADVRQLGDSLLDIHARHENLIDGLLVLATSENEVVDPRPVDLADVVTHVVAMTRAEAAAAGVTVQQAAAEAVTSGNALLIERVVHNLVENGIRHNRGPAGWVRVTSRAVAGGRVQVEVTNTGQSIQPHEVPALFEPFHRRAGNRQVTGRGAGLGLSIVRSVVGNHGGGVDAVPRDGGGLVVTVTLPAFADHGSAGSTPAPAAGDAATICPRML